MKGRISRRAMVAGAACAASLALLPRASLARGRMQVGGRPSLHVPWPVLAIDPHRIDDVAAALFGDALFDTLYARDDAGNLVPQLAEAEPEPDRDGIRVRVRSGIVSAYGRPIDAREVVNSLRRVRANGGAAWLEGAPNAARVDQLTVRFSTKDPQRLMQALASPMIAIVPLSFTPEMPDGTGPFRADRRGDALVLTRNPRAGGGDAPVSESRLHSP